MTNNAQKNFKESEQDISFWMSVYFIHAENTYFSQNSK